MKENKKLPNDIMSLMSNPPQSLDDVFNDFDGLAEERFMEIYSLRPYAELLEKHSKKSLTRNIRQKPLTKHLKNYKKIYSTITAT